MLSFATVRSDCRSGADRIAPIRVLISCSRNFDSLTYRSVALAKVEMSMLHISHSIDLSHNRMCRKGDLRLARKRSKGGTAEQSCVGRQSSAQGLPTQPRPNSRSQNHYGAGLHDGADDRRHTHPVCVLRASLRFATGKCYSPRANDLCFLFVTANLALCDPRGY